MKRVLSWLCLIIAVALWPQSAFAEETYYLSYNNGPEWKHSEKTFTQSGDVWSATIPAGNGDSNGWYYLIIRNFNPGSGNDWHQTRFHGTDTGNDCEITTNPSKITKQDNISKSLVIKGQKGKEVTVKFTLANQNGYEVNAWYEVNSTTYYYGYQGNYGNWTHLQPLSAVDGKYSFVIDNTSNQTQFFYITNNNTDKNGDWPKYRFHGTNTADDTPVTSTPLSLTLKEVGKTLKIENAKNNKITVEFTVNADGTISVNATKTGGEVVDDPYTKVNLPLRPQDFKVGDTDVNKPHYFLVGTRMADWRLQPEWELEDLGNNKVGIKLPRIMYTGLISVAKVDNYDDYSYSRYTRFSSTDNNGKSFNQYNLSSNLTNKGQYAYYRDGRLDYNSVDRFCAASDFAWNNDAVQKNKGILCNEIVVTLNDNGDPSHIEFVLSENPYEDVNKYLTFSLVGGNIIHEGMADADKTAKGMNSWQDAWVQYNPETSLPYRDATGRLFYQTVFQTNWLDKHPSFFNKVLADGRDFPYTSQSIIMRNVESMTDKELEEDDYAEYYKRFEGQTNALLGGDQNVKLGTDMDYKEFMRFHNSYDNPSYGGRNANWQCFVVKDMWMDGTFKVWTGWGGGLKNIENTGNNDNTDARWYFVNGGHGHENCKGVCDKSDHNGAAAEIRGYDLRRKNAEVGVYATMQDVNEADFNIKNLTYFKRVIVWYDPDSEEGFNNSAVQLIIERLGPAIQAVRGTLGSQINYTWNIPDAYNDFSPEEKAMHVQKYVITRYKLNEETNEYESMGVIENVGDQGKTVADYLDGSDPVTDSNLTGGTYRYRIDLELRDSGNNVTKRFAMSNRVTLFDASQPVKAEAFQVTEGEGDAKKYSFDLELDLDLSNFAVSSTYQGQGVTDLAKGYIIWIPEGTQNDLNEATAKTIDCHGVKTDLDNFVSDPVEVTEYGQTFIKQGGCWVKVPFTKGHIAKKVVWENIIKSVPGAVYHFEVFLMPNDDPAPESGLPMYKTIFAQANFGSTKVDTEFLIPGVGVSYEGCEVVKYDPTGDGKKLLEDTPENAMPMGTHMNDLIHAPIHYTAANNLRGVFSFTEPAVTDKVKENFTLDYGYADANMSRDDLTPVARFADFDNYKYRDYLDVSELAETLDGVATDGNTYLKPAVGKFIHLMTVADVKYRRNGKVALPLNMAVAEGNVTLPALVAPEFEIKGQLTTNEQDDVNKVRHYVHELYANISFTNTSAVTMIARPGFHLQADKPHGVIFNNPFGGTDTKEANGGVVAHKDLFGFNNDFFSYLDGYAPSNGSYDEDSDNWAYLSWIFKKLPVYVNYFAAREKATTPDYMTGLPKLSGVIAYHYPFIVNKEAVASTQAANSRDGGNHTIVTLTAVGNGSMDVDLPVATAIEDVTAEADGVEAEYFNLQGIPVAEPQAGQVYLVRRGAEVTKELYR